MSKSDIDGILRFIYNIVDTKKDLSEIKLNWFGGEPLLCHDEVIKPVLSNVTNFLAKKDIKFTSVMTTNGYLLDEKVQEFLICHNHKVFQITLDGNKQQHNRIRNTSSSRNTYDTIIHNIKSSVARGFEIIVRLNITEKTDLNIDDLVNEFRDVTNKDRERLKFSVHRVWQAPDYVDEIVENIAHELSSYGFNVTTDLNNAYSIRTTCYADKQNQVVINPRGAIYKCTARDFTDKNKEGTLSQDGEINWSEYHKKRLTALSINRKSCNLCNILPICNAGCSQKIIDAPDDDCIFGYSDLEKNEYARKILYNKINKSL